MTEKQIRDLFETWKITLGLEAWEITILFQEFEPPSTAMQCKRSVEYDRATIMVQPWVLSGTPPKGCIYEGRKMDVQRVVVHELLHCVFGPLDSWQNWFDGRAHPDALTVGCRAYDEKEEAIIDRLAVALVAAWDEP